MTESVVGLRMVEQQADVKEVEDATVAVGVGLLSATE
jgi:hypothetical protein